MGKRNGKYQKIALCWNNEFKPCYAVIFLFNLSTYTLIYQLLRSVIRSTKENKRSQRLYLSENKSIKYLSGGHFHKKSAFKPTHVDNPKN